MQCSFLERKSEIYPSLRFWRRICENFVCSTFELLRSTPLLLTGVDKASTLSTLLCRRSCLCRRCFAFEDALCRRGDEIFDLWENRDGEVGNAANEWRSAGDRKAKSLFNISSRLCKTFASSMSVNSDGWTSKMTVYIG